MRAPENEKCPLLTSGVTTSGVTEFGIVTRDCSCWASGFLGWLLRSGAVGVDPGAADVAQAIAEHVGAEEVAFFGA
jgi:hypothetical protein